MKVKQLIAKLQKEDPNRLVVCSCDAEGNAYSPLDLVQRSTYRAESTWSGEVGPDKSTHAEFKPALVLYPTN